jgi:hypothetical protein
MRKHAERQTSYRHFSAPYCIPKGRSKRICAGILLLFAIIVLLDCGYSGSNGGQRRRRRAIIIIKRRCPIRGSGTFICGSNGHAQAGCHGSRPPASTTLATATKQTQTDQSTHGHANGSLENSFILKYIVVKYRNTNEQQKVANERKSKRILYCVVYGGTVSSRKITVIHFNSWTNREQHVPASKWSSMPTGSFHDDKVSFLTAISTTGVVVVAAAGAAVVDVGSAAVPGAAAAAAVGVAASSVIVIVRKVLLFNYST